MGKLSVGFDCVDGTGAEGDGLVEHAGVAVGNFGFAGFMLVVELGGNGEGGTYR